MKTKYFDLNDQTYGFPQEEFNLRENMLEFHITDPKGLAEQHGAPLRFKCPSKILEDTSSTKGYKHLLTKRAEMNICLAMPIKKTTLGRLRIYTPKIVIESYATIEASLFFS